MHPSSSSNVQQPWHFDENIYPDIIAAENMQDDRPYRLVEGGALDYKRVGKLYDESPYSGYTIALVEVIYDQRVQERFEVELNFLEQRASATAAAPFKANWVEECVSPEEKKARQHVLNHLVKRSQTPSGFRHVKVLPMFHATKESLVDSIIRVGFTVLAKRKDDHNDPGYFGKGIYHTSSAKYAYGVYGSDHILLFNWASYFAAYPIVHNNGDWLDKHAGKEHYNNYDAHYVLVNPLDPNNPNENSYFPIQGTEQHTYDELIIFQSNQILPRYVVHLEPTGLNLKQVPTKTDSIFDSILGLFSSKVELTVSSLIQKINNYLKSKKRLEIEKSLDISTKKDLETELKHKLENLSKRDPKAHLENEESWLLRQLLCIQKNRNEKIAKLLLNALFARLIPQDSQRTFVGLLQSYYKSKNAIPRLFKSPLHIEQNYVQLVLIESQHEKQSEVDLKEHELPLSFDLDDLFEIKKNLNKKSNRSENPTNIPQGSLNEKKDEEKPPRHVAIAGRAGIGKSTLCQYMCYQWANGKLWNDKFEALIWIPLRQLINTGENDSLYDLIRRFCILPSGRNEITGDQIKEYLFQSAEKVLFVLDGYDEISGSLKEGSLIYELMQELLQQKNILITTRGHAIHELKVDRVFENLGFSQSHINEYITKNLPSKDSDTLQKQLKCQLWLSEIATVPLNLELICSTWEGQNKALFETMSTLYIKFTLDLFKRFLLRKGVQTASSWELSDIEAKYSAETQFLEHLAWEGLVEKKLVLSLKEEAYHKIYLKHRPTDPAKRVDFEKALLEMGFIRTAGTSSIFSEQEFEFPHLTFQEFFAAKYICRFLFTNNVLAATESICLHKFNPQFQLVWSFVAGILSYHPEKLRLFFQLLDLRVDLAGFYGFQLKMRCLEEARWSNELPNLDHELQTALYWIQWLSSLPNFVVDEGLLKSFKANLKLNRELAAQIDFSELLLATNIFGHDENRYRRHNFRNHRNKFSHLLNIIEITEDFGLRSLTLFLEKSLDLSIYTLAVKMVFAILSEEEKKLYATEIFKFLTDASCESISGDVLHKTGSLEKLAPELLTILQTKNPGESIYNASIWLLGMADDQLVTRYPQIVSIFIEIIEKNEYKDAHHLVFESLVSLLIEQSENEQIYLFFLKLQGKHDVVLDLIFGKNSLPIILKILDSFIPSIQKNINLLENIIISSISYSLSKYDTHFMKILSQDPSAVAKKLSLKVWAAWLTDQVKNKREDPSYVSSSSFFYNRFYFYWKFLDLEHEGEYSKTFYYDMRGILLKNLNPFLDEVFASFQNKDSKSLFRALRIISSFDEEFFVKIYLKNPDKIDALLKAALTDSPNIEIVNAMLGLISTSRVLTPELTIKIGTLFQTNFRDPNYSHPYIAAYNLCIFACHVPQFAQRVLHLLFKCLDSQYEAVRSKAISALKNAFWKDAKRSKEIGEILVAAVQQKKTFLKMVGKELLAFMDLYPEKKRDVVSGIFQRFKNGEEIDEVSILISFINKSHNHLDGIYRENESMDFFEDISILYEFLLIQNTREEEMEIVLKKILELMVKRCSLSDGWVDCFAIILSSNPESINPFIQQIVSDLHRSRMLVQFISRCSKMVLEKGRLKVSIINENRSPLILDMIFSSLALLKNNDYLYDFQELFASLLQLIQLHPNYKIQLLDFILNCDGKNLTTDGHLDGLFKTFLSKCDLSLASFNQPTIERLIYKSNETWVRTGAAYPVISERDPKIWAFDGTPFSHLIDRLLHEKHYHENDFKILRTLCSEAPEAFAAISIPDLIARVNQDKINREEYLRIVLLICIHEGIGLFIIGEQVCFYRNGLQKHNVTDPKWFNETSQSLSKRLLKDLSLNW